MLEHAIEKGKRLAIIRGQLASSRANFEKKYGISANTLRYWEKPDEKHPAGLTEKGAKTIVAIARKEGIYCTINWLMHGNDKKTVLPSYLQNQTQLSTYTELQDDIYQLLGKYENLLSYKISDDLMAPIYQPDDLIAGLIIPKTAFHVIHNTDCIVETENEEIVFGHVTRGETDNLFNVLMTNRYSYKQREDLYNIRLLKAAPVILILKNQPNS